MSEYWKSVPRKFCDFCKCWITDNKPSVEFHERGKRHKENVEKRLKEVRKRSVQEFKDQETLDNEMAKMEKAALEAFKKDLKDNPALAAQYGVSLEPKPVEKSESENSSSTEDSADKSRKRKWSQKKKEWYEAVTPEGYSYYWNTVTGESTWTAPKEYMSVVDQAEENSQVEEEKKKEAEPSAGVSPEPSESLQPSRVEPTPDSRTGFGSWEVVREEPQPVLYDESSAPPDLNEIPLPTVLTEAASEDAPPKPKFKEKTVTSLGSSQGGPVTFKKRKVASGARNVRQRAGDD